MSKKPVIRYTNHYLTDDAGHRYRITISNGGHVMFVGRKTMHGETALAPWGPKANRLVTALKDIFRNMEQRK